jgi:hypothetical protein
MNNKLAIYLANQKWVLDYAMDFVNLSILSKNVISQSFYLACWANFD